MESPHQHYSELGPSQDSLPPEISSLELHSGTHESGIIPRTF